MGSTAKVKLVITTCFLALCLTQQIQANGEWQLKLLHTNDMHARFHQTSATSSECLPKQAKLGQCYGGFARLATLIRQARNSTGPTFFLNAGNTYFPSSRYNLRLRLEVATLLNMLHPDVISLGNHEFDQGINHLIEFINTVNSHVVAANVDPHDEPKLAATKFAKSVILKISNANKIGVIGYLTPDTKSITSTGKVSFHDPIECIKEEVNKLRDEGVKILIALGQSGFEYDKKIAGEVDGLDLIIGGHDNTFLYNGPQPDLEEPIGPYPTEVSGVGGRKVYVVQAYGYTKYLGNLIITFNRDGEITNIDGNPILLDKNIPEAPDVLEELHKWRPVPEKFHKYIVHIKDSSWDGKMNLCGANECDLGDMITDAMINYNKKKYSGGGGGWTDVAIAMLPSGNIKMSFEDSMITLENIIEMLPSSDQLVIVELTGSSIIDVLESSLDLHTLNLFPRCLQVSGLKVDYDMSKPQEERTTVQVRCASCETPSFGVLDKNAIYKVLMPNSLFSDQIGYSMLPATGIVLGITTDQVVVDYLATNPTISLTRKRIQYPQHGH